MRLDVANPARAAGGEHGELDVFAAGLAGLLDALEQLGALFHDGEVGREIGIEYVVEAHHAQDTRQALDRRVLVREAQALAPGGAHCGRHLHKTDLIGVAQGVEDALGVVTGAQGAGRTMGDALAAQGAVGLGQLLAAGDVHHGVARAAREVPHTRRLDLLANLDAAQALDALVVVANEREGGVGAEALEMLGKRQVGDAKVVGERLQRAVARTRAARALGVMLRQQELHVRLARDAGLLAVGVHDHAVEHVVVASGDELVDALDLNHAHAAGADLVQVAQIAQRRNLDAHARGGIEDGRMLGYLDLAVVDDQLYHWKFLPPRNAPKPK